jgi:tRNA A37 threonylcarbamoyladenosine modification protein TsaB
VATDARRAEVYWAGYDASGTRIDGPRVGPADEIEAPGTWLGYGSLLRGRIEASLSDLPLTSPLLSPTGEWVARVGRLGEPSTTVVDLSVHGGDGSSTAQSLKGRVVLAPKPLYLRRPDAIAPVSVAPGVVS